MTNADSLQIGHLGTNLIEIVFDCFKFVPGNQHNVLISNKFETRTIAELDSVKGGKI